MCVCVCYLRKCLVCSGVCVRVCPQCDGDHKFVAVTRADVVDVSCPICERHSHTHTQPHYKSQPIYGGDDDDGDDNNSIEIATGSGSVGSLCWCGLRIISALFQAYVSNVPLKRSKEEVTLQLLLRTRCQ